MKPRSDGHGVIAWLVVSGSGYFYPQGATAARQVSATDTTCNESAANRVVQGANAGRPKTRFAV